MKKKHQIFIAFIIDLSIIYSIVSLFQGILPVEFYPTLLITYFFYNTFFFLLRKETYGKDIVGLEICNIKNNKLSIVDFFYREFLKLSISFFIPCTLILFIFPLYSLSNVVIISFFIFILLISVWSIFFKEFWWNLYSHTKHIESNILSKRQRSKKIVFIFILFLAFFYFKFHEYNSVKSNKIEHFTNSFNKHFKNRQLTKHVEFLKKSNDKPKEYILKLFDKYDLVIICERTHSESTQWQLIYDICSDKRFVEKVGNVFTEYGSFSKQEDLNQYLNKNYNSEEILNRNTAFLMRSVGFNWPIWPNTNFYDFLKKINNLNNSLSDSKKIKIYFSDIMVDWQKIKSLDDYEKYSNLDRDKIMADHIIQRINAIKDKKKNLIILNYRHAFNFFPNAGYYLFKAFPNKTANVLLNSVSMKFGSILTPINDGIWDASFEKVDNKEIGFNFENSPFGSDFFDLYPLSRKVRFQDVFTGFVFYKPLKDHYKEEGYPYMFDGFQDEYINRVKASGNTEEEARKTISLFNRNQYICENMKYYLLINLIDFIFTVLLLFISTVNLFYYFIRCFTNSKAN